MPWARSSSAGRSPTATRSKASSCGRSSSWRWLPGQLAARVAGEPPGGPRSPRLRMTRSPPQPQSRPEVHRAVMSRRTIVVLVLVVVAIAAVAFVAGGGRAPGGDAATTPTLPPVPAPPPSWRTPRPCRSSGRSSVHRSVPGSWPRSAVAGATVAAGAPLVRLRHDRRRRGGRLSPGGPRCGDGEPGAGAGRGRAGRRPGRRARPRPSRRPRTP